MMRNRYRTGLAALMGLSVLAVAAVADEEKIAAEKLPAAVKKAVKKKFPEAKIHGAAKEVEDGKTTYEVELKVEGRSVDVALNAEGKILEIEKEIPVAKLPEAVKKRWRRSTPGPRSRRSRRSPRARTGRSTTRSPSRPRSSSPPRARSSRPRKRTRTTRSRRRRPGRRKRGRGRRG